MIKNSAVAMFILLLAPVQTALGDEPVTPEQLIQRYDAALINELRDFKGNPAELLAGQQSSRVHDIAREVFDGHWALLAEYSELKLAALGYRPADEFSGEPVHTLNMGGEIAVALRVAGLGTRAAMKLWDPETAADTFSMMAIAQFSNSEEIALNAVLGGLTSKKIFRTEWEEAPAIGVESGLWITIVAYERDIQGHFLPLTISVFER